MTDRDARRWGVPDALHHTDTSETLEYIQGWNDCRQAMLSEQALNRMAENARELGLDYEPAQKRPQNCGTGYCSCIECVMEPAQQEPVAWWDAKLGVFDEKHFDQLQPLYTSPPAQRKPLTDEQIWGLAANCLDSVAGRMQFARAIEAAHGITKGNT